MPESSMAYISKAVRRVRELHQDVVARNGGSGR